MSFKSIDMGVLNNKRACLFVSFIKIVFNNNYNDVDRSARATMNEWILVLVLNNF